MVASTTSPSQLVEVLEDLSTRFILNLPSSELSSIPRIIFQVEQAYWYYSDHVQPSFPATLPTCTLKTFSSLLFQVCPLLEKWEPQHEKVFVEFMKYKSRVPVCGAILVSEGWEKVLMVRGWKGSTWGWPKGKINQNEEKHVCAAREVLEETGFDPTPLLDPKHFIELTIADQRITLFIVPNVPLSFPFLTQTRKEIGAIEWFRLKDLPGWKKRAPGSSVVEEKERATYSRNAHGNKFYLTTPFVGHLKRWIKLHKPSASSNQPLSSSPPTNGLPSPTVTPATISPSVPHAEIEGPEGGTKENRISELDELFARFLQDSDGKAVTSHDGRTSDSDDERLAPLTNGGDGGNHLNELLAGLHLRQDSSRPTSTAFSADTGISSAASAVSLDLGTPSLPPQHLYHNASVQQRPDDRAFAPPPHSFAPSPHRQHSHGAPPALQSHGSLPSSLLQPQPPFFGIPTSSSDVFAAHAPPARADKEKKLLDLLESSLLAAGEPSTPRYSHLPLHGSPFGAQHGSPQVALAPVSGLPPPQNHQSPQQQRQANLLDILKGAGGGTEPPFINHSPQIQNRAPPPQSSQFQAPPAPFSPPSGQLHSAHSFPSSPVVLRPQPGSLPAQGPGSQPAALLSMFNTPPPPPPSQPFHHNAPVHHSSPTPSSAQPSGLSGEKQSLLNILGSPPQQPIYHVQHHQRAQQQTPDRPAPGGERERLLLNLLGAAGSSPSASKPLYPPQASQHASFPPSPAHHHPNHQLQQHQQDLQQMLRLAPTAPSPSAPRGNGLLDILNSASPVRGGRVAAVGSPGYPSGSPLRSTGPVPAPPALLGGGGRGVNGLPLFGM